jgi:hypothetical protein
LRIIIAIVHVGIVKIYVAAVEAFRKKERRDEIQIFKTNLGPSYFILLNFIPNYAFEALLCQN